MLRRHSRSIEQSDFTNHHLYHACYWASGGISITKDDIPEKIQQNSWLNFTWDTWIDPWLLETEEGDCRVHSALLEAALKVIGVDADGVSSAEDATYRVGRTRWCTLHLCDEFQFYQEINSGPVTNFEAVCQVYLSDKASPYNWYFDKAMGSPYQAGSYANMWTEWESNPPPNHKIIHHYVDLWQNHTE